MKWTQTLRRWTMRTLHASMLGAALLASAGQASAQTPPAAAQTLPGAHYHNGLTIDLPVTIPQNTRLTLSEIRLYSRTPTTAWKLMESGPAHLTRFNCKVTKDGEYWYALAIVDNLGRMSPPEINADTPVRRVVVDTTAPVILVQAAHSHGDFCLKCSALDAHLDAASLKAHFKTEFGDIPLEAVADQPGVFRVKGAEPMKHPVVVSARDQAGNIGTRMVNVREMIGSTLTQGQTAMKPPADITQAGVRPEIKENPFLPMPRVDAAPPRLEGLPPAGVGAVPERIEVPPPLIKNPITTETQPKLPNPLVETPLPRGAVPHQIISTTRASVEYRIEQVGPSGIGKVLVYMTPDNGQTWHPLGEDPDKQSPANLNLPGDGVYGIRIVVTNGNGFGGKAPVRGDLPHCTIEVDSTLPFVQLRSAEVLPSTGHIELRWNATDKNLGGEPVTLSYRSRADGPWQAIARNIKNDGIYRWPIPRDIGAQIFFRVEVADQAGNIAHDLTRQPVLIDLSEPHATVLGVTGSATPPRPN